jgi:glutathione S-transferase
MADELVFYTNPMSRGRVVRWMLEEVGQPYRTEILEYGTTIKGREYLAVNPMGKVPALRHGDATITETAAICAYLADAFPQAGLAPPAGTPLRGPYYRWLFFGAGPVEAAMMNQAFGLEVPADRQAMSGYGSLTAVVDVLDGVLTAREYLVGDRFSAADIYVGSQIGFATMFGALEKRPIFMAYVARLNARPAAIRAREIDDALLPEDQRPPA